MSGLDQSQSAEAFDDDEEVAPSIWESFCGGLGGLGGLGVKVSQRRVLTQ